MQAAIQRLIRIFFKPELRESENSIPTQATSLTIIAAKLQMLQRLTLFLKKFFDNP